MSTPRGLPRPVATEGDDFPEGDYDDFSEIDAVLARSAAVLDGSAMPRPANERDPLVYDADWDEDGKLEQWRLVLNGTERLSPVLRAAILLDAWNAIEVLQHRAALGRQLVASLLRRNARRRPTCRRSI